MCIRQLLPLLPKQAELAVYIVLDKENCLLIHLLSIAVDKLDSVIIVWIVAC